MIQVVAVNSHKLFMNNEPIVDESSKVKPDMNHREATACDWNKFKSVITVECFIQVYHCLHE